MNTKQFTPPAALFGYSHLYGGVPKANVGPLVIPGSLDDERVLFLSDILPTGYQAAENAQIGPGSSVAVFGAGPVGLMAVARARLLGAEKIFIVDNVGYRLQFAAETYGAIPINFDDGDAAEAILQQTNGRGVDVSIDAGVLKPRAARPMRC